MQVMELQEVTTNRARGIHELLEKRFSPYAFSSRPVEGEELRKLLEAARSAPSSYNEQPWRFVLATRRDREAFERLLQTIAERNREWAHHAPVLVLSVAKLDFTHSGKPNRHAFYDVGQAASLRSPDGRIRCREGAPTARHPPGLRAGGDDGRGISGRPRARAGSAAPARQASPHAQAARFACLRRDLGRAMAAGCGRRSNKGDLMTGSKDRND